MNLTKSELWKKNINSIRYFKSNRNKRNKIDKKFNKTIKDTCITEYKNRYKDKITASHRAPAYTVACVLMLQC